MANVTKFTPKKREDFLEALSEYCSVTKAAQHVGLTRTCLYRAREEDKVFAAAWDEARQMGVGALEDEAVRRAMDKKKPSDNLLMFLLKGEKPEKYVDRYRHAVTETAPIVLTDAQVAATLSKMLAEVATRPTPERADAS